MKITTRCGETAITGLNEALLAKADEAKVLKTNRVRADTTVIEANVAYPSDSSLLAKGVAKMAKAAKKLKTMGLARRTRLADKTRTVQSRARSINANLRRRNDDKIAEVRRINGELAGIAEQVAPPGLKALGQANSYRRIEVRGEETSAVGVEVLLTGDDLVCVVPRKQQENLRVLLLQRRGRDDPLMRAGHVQPLLGRCGVDHQREQLCVDAAVIQHDAALGRGPVADHLDPVGV